MAVTAHQRPDSRTISDFRKRHLNALGSLFGPVRRLCQGAAFVRLGHVALDGTKLHADVPQHQARSQRNFGSCASCLDAPEALDKVG